MRSKFNISLFWGAHPLFLLMADFSPSWAVAGLAWSWVVLVFGVQIGAHRYFTHASFATGPVRAAALNFLAVISAMGTPQDWMVVHTYHHRYADTERDPTNWRVIGLLRNYTSLWQGAVPVTKESARLVARSFRSARARFFYHGYVPIILAWGAGLLLVSPQAFAWLFLLPVLVCHWAMNLLNHLGHRGDPAVGGVSTSWLFNLITPGDGYHKFHHDNPRVLRYGRFDLLAFLVGSLLETKSDAVKGLR